MGQWYQFSIHPELVYDYFTSGSDSLLFGSYPTPEELAPGNTHIDRWIQVYPGVSRDMAIEYDIWDHKYRRKLKGDLTFLNNQNQLDYNILADIIDNSLEVKIRIEQTCVTTASDWWEGYFSIVDGDWDSDRGLFTVNPSPDDLYRQFEEQGDKEFNLIDLNGTLAETFYFPIAQQMIMSQTVDVGTSNNAYEAAWPDINAASLMVTKTPTDNDSWDNWYQWAPLVVTPGFTWRLRWYRDISKIQLTADYQRNTDVGFPQFLHEYPTDVSGEGYQFFSPKHNGKTTWAQMLSSDWIDLPGGDSIPTTDYTITLNARGFLLKDAIQYIVGAIKSGTSYKSTFLDNSDYPDGTPESTNNYVTGAANKLNHLVMYQKSDIQPTSDPATVGKITFNDFMSAIKNTFNADWYIDENEDFRIEHWSYFTSASDIDLTLLDSGKWINKKNKWAYELEDMPNMERFKFMESLNPDFVGKDIIYNRIATFNRYKDNVSELSVPWTTDIMYAYGWPDKISDEGFMLLQTSGSDVIENEVGLISSISMPNGHLSWANLHYNYWRHGRIISKGNMNGSDITFLSYQRKIKQTEITYPECCGTFDPMALKVTELGEGEVRAAEYRLIDGSVKTVFFYLDIKASDFPVPETYYILINGTNRLLWKDSDILIWYG
jgi:hypothetical protein